MSPSSAFGYQHSLVKPRKIKKHLSGFGVIYNSPGRYFDFHIFAVPAMPVRALSVTSTFSPKCMIESKFQQRVFVRIRDQINVPAVAAVAAAGPAFGNELLPAECDAAVAAAPCFNCNFGLVDEQLFYRVDGDESARTALVFELHNAGDFSKKRIVLADSDVDAGLELGPTLPHEDRSAADQLARKPLHAKPLRVAVAAVT